MKNALILLFGLFFIGVGINAQENRKTVIATSVSLWNPKLKVEHAFVDAASFGLHYRTFKGSLSQFKIEPFARYYFSENAPDGWYLQGKASFVKTNDIDTQILGEDVGFKSKDWISGMGIAFGRQLLVGRKDNIALDAFAGTQRYFTNGDFENYALNIGRVLPIELGFRIGIAF